MKLEQSLQHVMAGVLSGILLLMPSMTGSAETVSPDAIGSVTVDGVTKYFYDTPSSGSTTAMWREAISAKASTVVLYADWTSKDGSFLVEDGALNGVICIPRGCEITIDLNGYKIDRDLQESIEDGEVIYIQEGGILNLTDTNNAAGNSGEVTGGNNIGGPGGIMVDAGGTLNMWGGNITGNVTTGSGGGLMLAGNGSTLYMTGGTISNNSALRNGGGVAAVNGAIRLVGGTISENTAAFSGGGMYLQSGSAELSGGSIVSNTAETGGGICTSMGAELILKNNPVIQKNKAVSADEKGAGGGILAMSATAIQMSGSPVVTMNTNSNGTQSNLEFWMEEDAVYTTGRLEDTGLTLDAKIGVSFIGGKERDLLMESAYTGTNVFFPDTADFTVFEKDGGLLLRRPIQMPSTGTMIAIACAVAIVIGIIGSAILTSKQSKKKKSRKKKKAVR